MTPQKEMLFYDLSGDHDMRFSPFCWRTRACLLYKGIPFRAEATPFTAIPVRFKELGIEVPPKSATPTVPFLVDGDYKLVDSWDIALYLDQHFPGRPLFPGEGMKEACRFFNGQVVRLLHGPIFKLESASIRNLLIPEDKEYFTQKVKRQTGAEIEEWQAKAAELEASVNENLKFLGAFVTADNKEYVFGPVFTFADIALFATLKWLVLVSDKHEKWLEIDSGLMNWWKRMHTILHLD